MNSTNEPLVTVIIPTYNRAKSVLRAIESVRQQTYSNIQLIVVDDGSLDDTAASVSGLTNLLFIHQNHGGQAKARNSGLAAAKGSYIASLDSDDYWCPDFLQKSISTLHHHDLDFVFSNWNQQFGANGWIDAFSKYHALQLCITDCNQAWHFLGPSEVRKLFFSFCPSPSSSMVMRRSSMADGWNESMNIADDWFLQMEIITKKPCRAAFTMERLWHKCQDGINICDGRNPIEVIQLLYVDDSINMIRRLNGLITRQEYNTLSEFQISGLMELASHSLIHSREFKSAWAFFWRSFRIRPSTTILKIPALCLAPTKKILKQTIDFNFPPGIKIVNLAEVQ